ncbi:MAG TPA: M66 family metalloprotease [Polyangiaceae bacterium]|nr:M66 family metalloprotease [Polyangiaceae bacterium]
MRILGRFALALCVAVLSTSACGGGSSDPTALVEPIAQNITIDEVAILQTLKVPIMQGGAPADRGRLPLIAMRDSVLRVYVTPGDGWSPHAVTARVKIVASSPTGSFAQVFSASQTISGPSTEQDLGTTINVPIPGLALEPGSSFVVVLNDTQGDPPTIGSTPARWPSDGSLSDLAVRDGGDCLRVMIVPVEYAADGSHRLPDTSDAQLQAYHDLFYKLYPAASVDITVHDPWYWGSPIYGSGSGFDTILNALKQLRTSDQPDPDVYYYAAFEPTSSFQSYCGGGCTTGLSFLGAPFSVGIGFFGDATTETAAHEVGHAHGLAHAPCGGAAAPDPAYPYPGALIGVWGYDPILQYMVDPTAFTDLMSYCSPTWISDFHYAKIFSRVRMDNQYYADYRSNPAWRGAERRFFSARVAATGEVTLTQEASREPWILNGQPRELTWASRTGATLGSGTAYYFPYDHLPGGMLYVPDGAPPSLDPLEVRVAGLGPVLHEP